MTEERQSVYRFGVDQRDAGTILALLQDIEDAKESGIAWLESQDPRDYVIETSDFLVELGRLEQAILTLRSVLLNPNR